MLEEGCLKTVNAVSRVIKDEHKRYYCPKCETELKISVHSDILSRTAFRAVISCPSCQHSVYAESKVSKESAVDRAYEILSTNDL